MQIDSQTITFLSLLIALIAAIGGPAVAYRMGKRQTDTQMRIAQKQVIAPMRQAWINNLRELVGEILGRSEAYRLADKEQKSEAEKVSIATLENKLLLYINPRETDHNDLVSHVRIMLGLIDGIPGDGEYWKAKKSVVDLAQKILKAEWNRTKDDV